MRPEEVPAALIEKAAEAIVETRPNAGGGYDILFEDAEDYARHALGAVLRAEGVWEGGPGALPLPPQVITHEGVFHEDGVTPMEITDEAMRTGGWKKRQRLVTEWVDA